MKNKTRQLNRLARKIIRSNEYVTLATTNARCGAWVAIVAYSFDRNWNLYFVSIPGSKHGKNLKLRKTVACSIFDSQQLWGHGVGLQIEANCKIIAKKEFKDVSRVYFRRKYPFGEVEANIAKFFKTDLQNPKGLYRFYKITPKTIWMNNPYSETDNRVKINLNA